MEWKLRDITRPLVVPEISAPGGGSYRVARGSLLHYCYHEESMGGRALAEVLRTPSGDEPEKADRPTLLILAITPMLDRAYLRAVPIRYVLRVVPLDSRFRDFFLDPGLITYLSEELVKADRLGYLSDNGYLLPSGPAISEWVIQTRREDEILRRMEANIARGSSNPCCHEWQTTPELNNLISGGYIKEVAESYTLTAKGRLRLLRRKGRNACTRTSTTSPKRSPQPGGSD